jgi:hypothetical protein
MIYEILNTQINYIVRTAQSLVEKLKEKTPEQIEDQFHQESKERWYRINEETSQNSNYSLTK